MTLYEPHPRQVAFHSDPRPIRWFCAGYGTGKTRATVIEAFVNATLRHPGYTGIVAAPTYALLFQSWVDMWKEVVPRGCWRLSRDSLTGPHLLVTCPGGEVSKIYLRSTDNPWSNEGINAAWLVFDEATRERDRAAFDVLASRVRQGYPGRQRAILISGPPMTRRHWTSVEFGAGPGDGREGDLMAWHSERHAVVRARTRDNPFLEPGYEAGLRARPGVSASWCKQWLDAEFGAMDGQIYASFSRDVHVVPASEIAGRQWRRVIVGTDWGWSHPGVMLAVAQDGYGDLYVVAEEVHRERLVADVPNGWVPTARALWRSYKPEAFACDPSLPGNLNALHRGLPGPRVYGADNDVAEGLRCVSAHLERAVERDAQRRAGGLVTPGAPALYVSSACTHTIGEFESYSRKKARDGSVTETPTEVDDDAMDALRYAVMSLTSRVTR